MKYKKGDWLAVCDVCARRFYGSQLRKRWDNLMVCEEDYETRHPQDFVRAVKDNHPVPFVRKEAPDGEVEVTISSAVEDAAYNDIPAGTFGDYSP